MKKAPPNAPRRLLLATALLNLALASLAGAASNEFAPPEVGTATLRLLSPSVLELSLITTKQPPPANVSQWSFVSRSGQLFAPDPSQFQVSVDGQPVEVQSVGFRRRPVYAAYKARDLRIGNSLYLQLGSDVAEGQQVSIHDIDGTVWATNAPQAMVADPLRWSPAIHVNQGGYLPSFSKKARIGYYLGSFGELSVSPTAGFNLVDTTSGETVYQGSLVVRPDIGYTFKPAPYQQVLEADFTEFNRPGEYRLQVPGLGVSYPFRIDEGAAGLFARTYALGIYHQRCGMANELPYTRDTHGACHIVKAEVPTMAFTAVNKELADFSSDFANNPRHIAPQLKNVDASLYPFVNTNKVDVSGGHHDAGDYSKYTINVAQLIHALVFAVDALPGVANLDNLGLPESGDGKSDLLQEAKWEADFLAKMQDADGGFYFLVYPKTRAYEDNVLPDRGDTQVVFPKNTSATAAAVAALAQIASSPLFKSLYPEAAASYLAKAVDGWAFLQRAIAQYGRDGAYQKISHYGDEFMHDDEIAWAAAELFVATGDPSYQAELISHFNPSDRNTRRFTWWRLFEGYGCAIRSYAFAARTGRLQADQLDSEYLARCEAELKGAADDQVRFAKENAYGSSFPDPNKAYRSAGWYFSVEQTFDMVVANQINPKPEYLDAILSNMGYEAGCNPLNVAFLTGIGLKRQWETVNQYAQNDRRAVPPSGIPLGNLQKGFTDLPLYPKELPALCYPSDSATNAPYAPYDIWADTYNTTTEAVTVQQGRCLASMAWLMAQTSLAQQSWKPAGGRITTLAPSMPIGVTNTAYLDADGIDLSTAQIVWEGRNQAPAFASTFKLAPAFIGPQWIEAEALLPDGRRIFALGTFTGVAAHPITALGPSRFRVKGIAGQDFVLEYSIDLKEWLPQSTNTFTSNAFEFTSPAPDSGPQGFYRAVAP